MEKKAASLTLEGARDRVSFSGEDPEKIQTAFESNWKDSKGFRGSFVLSVLRWGGLSYKGVREGGTERFSKEGAIKIDLDSRNIMFRSHPNRGQKAVLQSFTRNGNWKAYDKYEMRLG